jgi:hypothetical protein
VSRLGAIDDFSTGTYSVRRRAAATRSGGRTVLGAASTFSVVASVQPAGGRDLRNLPEGSRGDETFVVYAYVELRMDDEVTIRSEPHRVVRVEQHDAFGETHWRAWAVRQAKP